MPFQNEGISPEPGGHAAEPSRVGRLVLFHVLTFVLGGMNVTHVSSYRALALTPDVCGRDLRTFTPDSTRPGNRWLDPLNPGLVATDRTGIDTRIRAPRGPHGGRTSTTWRFVARVLV
jgi:hypothetical protein